MIKKIIIAAAAVVMASLSAAASALAADPCGTVQEAAGGFGAEREGAYTALSVGDGVYQFDIIKTDATGSGTIRFVDDTVLGIRNSSEISVKEIVSEEGRARFNVGIVEGTVRMVTGSIVRRNNRGVKVTTPGTTIGIRGTDIEISHIDSVTEVNVIETASTVSVTHSATGISVTGSTGLSVAMDLAGTASTINGMAVDLTSASSIAAAVSQTTGVEISTSTGETIGSNSAGSSGSGPDASSSVDDSGIDVSSESTEAPQQAADSDCGSEISAPGR